MYDAVRKLLKMAKKKESRSFEARHGERHMLLPDIWRPSQAQTSDFLPRGYTQWSVENDDCLSVFSASFHPLRSPLCTSSKVVPEAPLAVLPDCPVTLCVLVL